jgi:hypothetical protein
MSMTRSIELQTLVRASAQQASCDVHLDVVILDIEKGSYYGLEQVAARIWQLLQQPRKVFEIRDTIVAEYDVTPDRCERDLFEFLNNLSDTGLIECELGT